MTITNLRPLWTRTPRAKHRGAPPSPRTRAERREQQDFQHLLETLDIAERRGLVDLLRDELARGRVPARADLEAALLTVRRPGREAG